MYYRLSKTDFQEGKIDAGNKRSIKDLVWNEKPIGLIGLIDGQPVAWCAFAPREDFIKLEKSRVHKRIDNNEVWSIPCIFIDKHFRRCGISVQLLIGAIKYAREDGIKIIEAYPAIPTRDSIPDSFAWTGLYKSFERAGFEIADRKSRNRPMVRYYLDRD
jgi:GNAT superfamily N-acetyltransferase